MTLSPDRSWLACGTDDSEILMIPFDDDSIGYQLHDSTGTITALSYTDTDHLYSSTSGGSVNEWDLRNRSVRKVASDGSGIVALEISDDNNMLAALTGNGRLICWQTGSPAKHITINTGDKIITAHKFIPGGNRLATGDDTGTIDIWSTSTGLADGNASGHMSAVRGIAFDGADGQMLTADEAGEVRLWTMANLEQPPVVFTDGGQEVLRLAFSDGGESFLAATQTDVIRRPAHIRLMTDGLCDKVTRNLTMQEWSAYVGRDIEYETTCPDKEYRIRVREIRGAR